MITAFILFFFQVHCKGYEEEHLPKLDIIPFYDCPQNRKLLEEMKHPPHPRPDPAEYS